MSTEPGGADELPAYAFVPGGPWPHPNRAGGVVRPPETVPPIARADWHASASYLRGFRLFNAGYYWEAHEAWEALWHAHGRRGPTADLLKGLIRLAAAGVKVRERQPRGALIHASEAARLFEAVTEASGWTVLHGLDLSACAALARRVAANPPDDPAPPGARVSLVFPFDLNPR
jgi:uncharacterized protein